VYETDEASSSEARESLIRAKLEDSLCERGAKHERQRDVTHEAPLDRRSIKRADEEVDRRARVRRTQ
jgi:hypothetical protein